MSSFACAARAWAISTVASGALRFEDVQGCRRPMKIAAYRNGKKIMEAEIVDVKYLDKVDAAEFAKP